MTSIMFDTLNGFSIGEDDVEDNYLDEDFDMETEAGAIIRCHDMMDGAEDLLEAVEMLRAFTDILQNYADQGYELAEAIEDGRVCLKHVS